GDDALEAELLHALEQRLALALDVIERADAAVLRQHAGEQGLALEQRQAAQILAVEREQVEREVDGGQLAGEGVDLAGRGDGRALEQALEDGVAALVGDDELAVEDEVLRSEGGERGGDLG